MNVVISVGGRFHAVELARQLERRGMLETIITTKAWYVRDVLPRRRWHAIPAPELIGAAARLVPALRARGYYSWLKDNLFDGFARRYIPPCDIFHAWGNYALYSMPRARERGARVVIERGSTHPYTQDAILAEECRRHGVRVERAHPQIIAKGLREIEEADAVVIPSDFVRRSFLEHGAPAAKLAMIPYGFAPEQFRPAEKRDGVFRVLFVGNVSIQKGAHYLLEAWKRLALPGAELRFVGRVEADMKPVLDRYAGLFTHTAHVRHDAIAREYAAASVFVLPSLQEGSALVTYEAMACGLPLIVTDHCGGVLRDGVDGFVLPVRDSERLAEAIAWCHANPDGARAMGEAGRAYVQQFTWDRYAASVVDVYRRVLGGEAAGGESAGRDGAGGIGATGEGA